jgi:hypothetical protein
VAGAGRLGWGRAFGMEDVSVEDEFELYRQSSLKSSIALYAGGLEILYQESLQQFQILGWWNSPPINERLQYSD